jgi:hypothetical protein
MRNVIGKGQIRRILGQKRKPNDELDATVRVAEEATKAAAVTVFKEAASKRLVNVATAKEAANISVTAADKAAAVAKTATQSAEEGAWTWTRRKTIDHQIKRRRVNMRGRSRNL